jgi:hypothetical protein
MGSAATATVIEEMAPVSDKPDSPPNKRDTAMCVVEIECRTMAQAIPGGHLVRQGVARYRFYRGWLPVVMSQVASDEDHREFERAVKQHEKLLDAEMAKYTEHMTGVELELKRQEIRDAYPGSPEAIFCRDNGGRSMPPFERVTVVEDNLPAPADEQLVARQRETATLAAEVTAQVLQRLGLGQQSQSQPAQNPQKKQ